MTSRTSIYRRHPHHGSGGFTLVELVVASAITLVLATLLLSATGNILSTWNRSRGKLTTSNQAKLALDQLADDLEGLTVRADGNVWMAATISGTQTGTGDAGISDAAYNSAVLKAKPITGHTVLTPSIRSIADLRFGHVGVWLRFFATERAANDALYRPSAIRAISYQIAHIPEGTVVGSGRRYFLFRSSVRPGPFDDTNSLMDETTVKHSTFTTGYDIVAANAYNDPDMIDNQNPGDLLEPARIRRPIRSAIIASDVIDFGVRIYVRDNLGNLVERFPVDRSLPTPASVWAFLATTNSAANPTNPGTAPSGLVAAPVRDFPLVVEVMVRVLSDEGAGLILALENGNLTPPGGAAAYDSYWWELAEANSTVYTRRFEVKSVSTIAK